jgi:outer membrane protein TolC
MPVVPTGSFRWHALLICVFAFFWTVAAAADEPAPPQVTLKEAIRIAVTTHPLVQAAREDLAVFQARLLGANTAWLPKLQGKGLLSVTPAKTGNAIEGGTHYDDWGPYYSLEFSGILPLYTFGKIRNLKAMAQSGISVGEAQVQIARSHIESLVVEAWEGYVYTKALMELIEDGQQYMDRARRYLEDLRDKDDEAYDDVDMLKLRVYESEVESRRLEAEQARDTAIAALEWLTGQPEQALLVGAQKPFSVTLKSRDEYDALALSQRGEMRALKAAEKAQGRRIALEASQFFPSFFLGGYYKYARAHAVEQQASPFAYDPYNSWFAGLGLGMEWNFDAGTRIASLDEQKAVRRKLAAQVKVLRQRIQLDVQRALGEAQRAEKKIALDERAVRAARGWMIAKLDLYESGFADFRDMKESLAEYFLRRISYCESVYRFNVAIARLAQACGVPLESLVEPL